MANAATMRRAERERAKLGRLESKCEVCQRPITPGQTWKFTETGGKVHYHCAEQNPAGPTYHEAMVMARQAGARIGDTSGFEPWLVKAKLQTRSPQVLRYLQEQFESGVEEGEAPKRKLETTHKGVTIFRSGDGFSTSLDPGSIHDTLKDAKRFIDAQRNPATPWWKRKNSATDVNLAFIAGQIGQRGVAWAYPGASYQEVFYNDSDEYLMEKAGVDPKDFATVRSKARMVFESGMQKKSRNPRLEVTDRAFRYRANAAPPIGPKLCAFCGTNRQVQVGHVDGHEENGEPQNLMWTCRSCNMLHANTLRASGYGRLTRQYNPAARGAETYKQYALALMSMKGESDAMTIPAAVEMVHATPANDRSRFSREIWRLRRRHYGHTGVYRRTA